MSSYHSLKNKKEFTDVYRHGKHRSNGIFVLFKKMNSLDFNRYGVSVSKKVGNSVQRHRLNRISREAFRALDSTETPHHDYVISWRQFDRSLKSDDVLRMIKRLYEKDRH